MQVTFRRAHSRHRGTTLLEVAMAILVLTVAIPPVIGMYTEVGSRLDRDWMQVHAEQLAGTLLEEIESKAFEDPDGALGSFGTEEVSRRRYDDIDDFDDWSSSPPQNLLGASITSPSGFTRSATVTNVATLDPGGAAMSDGSTSLKRIDVSVAWSTSGGGEHRLSTLVARRPGGRSARSIPCCPA